MKSSAAARRGADGRGGFFVALMARAQFVWRHVHYATVRVFGGVVRRAAEISRQRKGRRVALLVSIAHSAPVVVP